MSVPNSGGQYSELTDGVTPSSERQPIGRQSAAAGLAECIGDFALTQAGHESGAVAGLRPVCEKRCSRLRTTLLGYRDSDEPRGSGFFVESFRTPS